MSLISSPPSCFLRSISIKDIYQASVLASQRIWFIVLDLASASLLPKAFIALLDLV